jgi:hypothetical protein
VIKEFEGRPVIKEALANLEIQGRMANPVRKALEAKWGPLEIRDYQGRGLRI